MPLEYFSSLGGDENIRMRASGLLSGFGGMAGNGNE
jgi:hypothetical protein